MNNNGIGPKNSPKQQTPPASPKEENTEGGGGLFGWFSKIVNVVTDATQMVRGTSNPDDGSKLTLTTANVTIVGDSTSYLDKIPEKAARSPIDYYKYRSTLAKAGDAAINGKYLSDEVSRTANSAYHSACRSDEKGFLAALYSLEANLQYQVAQHSALQKEIEELQRHKDALLNGQADAVKQNNADMVQRNIDTKTKQSWIQAISAIDCPV